MAKVISVINMKGGVGKTTLTVNLAWKYVFSPKSKVLIIDLDPQFNASQYLMGAREYKTQIIDNKSQTVWDIFEQNTKAPNRIKTILNRDTVIQSIWNHRNGILDLIPSRLELSFSLKNPERKEHLLSEFISTLENYYDVIFIDCAPTDSFLTTAAYLASEYLLIPVKPEYLSSIGLPLIESSIKTFSEDYNKEVPKIAGIVFNFCDGYLPEENLSKRDVGKIAKDLDWHVFKNEVPYSRSFPKGAREKEAIFWTKYARRKVKDKLRGLFAEFDEIISR
jgi:chromosome partitioning protein